MKVLFIVPYPKGKAGSQRFRFEQYLDFLDEKNVSYKFSSFWDEKAWEVLYQKGKTLRKLFALIRGLLRRYLLFVTSWKYDVFFIHREVYPVGLPIVEWFLAKVVKKKIVYDFDDAIWIPNYAENNKKFAFVKSYGHVKYLCRIASVVSAGNSYLENFARNFNSNVIINPTTIDTDNYHNQIKNLDSNNIVIGWTGTHSTIRYLLPIVKVLKGLESIYSFKFVVISDLDPAFDLKSFKFIKWDKATEIKDLMTFSIGIMPLTEDKWAKGKCGFKALQYMSLGIPAIVSPVGVNEEIVDHKLNGYVCRSEEDWKEVFTKIFNGEIDIKTLGLNARKKIESNYSVNSNKENFLNLFA